MKLLYVGGSLLLSLLTGLLTFLGGSPHFPRDPEDTLNKVRQGALRVGYTHAEPWVIPGPQGPTGIEPQLVQAFARHLHARITWVPGTEQALFQALKKHELDLVIAGITDESPWQEEVGLTRPYLETAVYVGQAPGGPLGTGIRGRRVAVPAGTDLGHYVRRQDGEPFFQPNLPASSPVVAGYDWQLRRWGRTELLTRLKKESHVLAVPPGENAWLLALESFLHHQQKSIHQLLR